jgi:hypothetical protein
MLMRLTWTARPSLGSEGEQVSMSRRVAQCKQWCASRRDAPHAQQVGGPGDEIERLCQVDAQLMSRCCAAWQLAVASREAVNAVHFAAGIPPCWRYTVRHLTVMELHMMMVQKQC